MRQRSNSPKAQSWDGPQTGEGRSQNIVSNMTKCEVVEFEEMIESALDAGRAAARVHRNVDEALADWPLINAFREGFDQESTTCEPSQLAQASSGVPRLQVAPQPLT
jgi:hypothetical protein